MAYLAKHELKAKFIGARMSKASSRHLRTSIFLLLAAAGGSGAQITSVNANAPNATVGAGTASSINANAPADSSLIGLSGGAKSANPLFHAGGTSFNTPFHGPTQQNVSGSLGQPEMTRGNAGSFAAALQVGGQGAAGGGAQAANTTTLPVRDAGGVGSYSNTFPDSTKGTAGLSPTLGMKFGSSGGGQRLGTGFKDLAQTQFLNPHLHAGSRSGSRGSAETDLYKRLQNHMKSQKLQQHAFGSPQKRSSHSGNPFSENTNGLKTGTLFDTQK